VDFQVGKSSLAAAFIMGNVLMYGVVQRVGNALYLDPPIGLIYDINLIQSYLYSVV